MDERVAICYATDDGYAQHAAASIASLLINSASNRAIDIYILNSNSITDASRAKLRSLESLRRDSHIIFLDVDASAFDSVSIGEWSVETCFRVLVPTLLPSVRRALYIDCDTIVLGAIEELMDIDMEGHMMAGVEDLFRKKNSRRLGLDTEHFCYCNAGVILMDLEQMRAEKFADRFFEEANIYGDKIQGLPDQDMINILMCNHFGGFKLIDLCWNLPIKRRNHSREKFNLARRTPKIIHYIATVSKPWNDSVDFPFKSEYWRYLAKTEYREVAQRHMAEPLSKRVSIYLRWIVSRYIWRSEIARNGKIRLFIFALPIYKSAPKSGGRVHYILSIPIFKSRE